MKYTKLTTSILTALLATIAGFNPLDAGASPYLIPNVPLIVSVRSIPNIWFELDDSGSMDWEILAGEHFSACQYDSVLRCDSASRDSGLMRDWNGKSSSSGKAEMYTFEYVYSLSDHAYGSKCPTGNQYSSSLEECLKIRPDDVTHRGAKIPYRQDWRMRSPDLNTMYFFPGSDYGPWPHVDDAFKDAKFTAARSWPVSGESGYSVVRNLSGFQYNIWIDDKGFKKPSPSASADSVTDGSNGIVDEWDSYIQVTLNSASSFTCDKVTHDPQTYFYSNSTNHELRGINPTMTSLSLADPACIAATNGKTAIELSQNVANWFQYARRRTQVMRFAVALVVKQVPEYRFGVGHINQYNDNHPIPAKTITDYLANSQAMLDVMYQSNRLAQGTPLRRGLSWVGEYYKGKQKGLDSPIIESCQKNFSLLFSDGFWNGSNPSKPTKDVDKDGQKISGNKVLLADVARQYYQEDLRKDIDDNVPTDAFDPANWQHLVTYTVSFGVQGFLVDSDGDGWPNPPLDVSSDWTQSGNDDLNKVDDMWHAAWNSRGRYFSAARPQDLVKDVKEIIENIGDRFGGAASAAANSGSISSSSKVFQAKFDTIDWHGELLAFPVTDDGRLAGAAIWNSNTVLTAKSNSQLRVNGSSARDVFSWNRAKKGTAFSWSSIGTAQADLLNRNIDGVVDSLGKKRLEYIRGDSSYELKKGGKFRNRDHKLGDIVNSDPVYVGYPPFFYSFDNYHEYFNTHVNRTGIVYFGANDGMFHAVREADGEELFAFVPSKVYPKLSKLTDPAYFHEFYVDGQPQYGDAQIKGAWKSVVASTLRSGGQGLFALDVTDPDSFTASDVLWEFTDEDDADLGYTFGQPQIKRMANDKWAIIVGNGINNTEDDGHASTTGTGAVFILFIEEGIDGWSASDYVKITVPGGSVDDPNAVFTPAAADVDGDSRIDFIYAGDRNGKMWKIDVSSKTPGSWKLAFNGNPLFDAGPEHPITDRPAIAPHPMGYQLGQLVLFGTGQFIEYFDNTTEDQPTQTMYGIWDLESELAKKNTSYGYSRSDLSKADFVVQEDVRVIKSGSDVNWLDEDGDPDERGWYIDLPEQGERIRRRPVLRNDLVFFTTLIPDDDPCAAGGTGWIMVLDTATGRAPHFAVFDIDSDQDVTPDGDLVGSDPDNPLTPVGVKSGSIPNLPAFIYDDRPGFVASAADFPPLPNAPRGCGAGSARAYTFTTLANGSIMAIETATELLSCGRQSWRNRK